VENSREQIRSVGLNPVDTPPEELPHDLGIVHRPDVHRNISEMSRPQEPDARDPPSFPRIGNLEGIYRRQIGAASGKTVREVEESKLAPGGGGGTFISMPVRSPIFLHGSE
jgi:hypothetical protein